MQPSEVRIALNALHDRMTRWRWLLLLLLLLSLLAFILGTTAFAYLFPLGRFNCHQTSDCDTLNSCIQSLCVDNHCFHSLVGTCAYNSDCNQAAGEQCVNCACTCNITVCDIMASECNTSLCDVNTDVTEIFNTLENYESVNSTLLNRGYCRQLYQNYVNSSTIATIDAASQSYVLPTDFGWVKIVNLTESNPTPFFSCIANTNDTFTLTEGGAYLVTINAWLINKSNTSHVILGIGLNGADPVINGNPNSGIFAIIENSDEYIGMSAQKILYDDVPSDIGLLSFYFSYQVPGAAVGFRIYVNRIDISVTALFLSP